MKNIVASDLDQQCFSEKDKRIQQDRGLCENSPCGLSIYLAYKIYSVLSLGQKFRGPCLAPFSIFWGPFEILRAIYYHE